MAKTLPRLNLNKLPSLPGVYLMKSNSGEVLYVGKAVNLKKRVTSYWSKTNQQFPKIQALVAKIKKIDHIVTDSEVEALILENQLIKKYRPPFNVVLRDDKSYQYLKIDLDEKYPTLNVVRKVSEADRKRPKSKVRYFGPYISSATVKNTLKLINSIFPICAKAKQLNSGGTVKSPCLNWHLKRCAGACVGQVSSEAYRRIMQRVVDFLMGQDKQALKYLEDKMQKLVSEKKFEAAAEIRDRIKSLEVFFERQKIDQPGLRLASDYIGVLVEAEKMVVSRIVVRSGKLIDQQIFVMRAPLELSKPELIVRALELIYDAVYDNAPQQIFVEDKPVEKQAMESWLSHLWGKQVKITVPQKGTNKKILLLAVKNAMSHSGSLLNLENALDNTKALKQLAKALKLKNPPKRLEAFDISHLGGTQTVGSMVVFEKGAPKKSEYRRFRVKTVSGGDDYQALAEVIKRRLSGKNIADKKFAASLPQAILIDGGKGQLSTVVNNLGKKDFLGIKFLSIAKKEELVYVPGSTTPLKLSRNSEALKLLQRLRDEAHRFALSYQVSLRAKQVGSKIDKIPQIGNNTRKKLIKAFGSLAGVKQATLKEVGRIIGEKKAKIVKEYL